MHFKRLMPWKLVQSGDEMAATCNYTDVALSSVQLSNGNPKCLILQFIYVISSIRRDISFI